VLIAGVIMLVIPGPGLLTMAAGLIILSTEFEWADKYLQSVKKKIKTAYDKSKIKQEKPQASQKKKK
jgi:hypothetical protein